SVPRSLTIYEIRTTPACRQAGKTNTDTGFVAVTITVNFVMDIVFFGSDNFAVTPLKALLGSSDQVLCVVTQPDKQKGRGLATAPTAVKSAAKSAGIEVYQPADINSAEAIDFLKKFNADLFIVAAYGQILSQDVLSLPRLFCLNIHASLLPKYRGASCINRAIIDGERASGVTIIKMAPRLDAGPVIAQKSIEIEPGDTSISLEEKLSGLAVTLLLETLKAIKNDNYSLTPQDEAKVTFAPKLKKIDGLIDWKMPAERIHNLIRGCLGWPGAFTYYRGKSVKIFQAHPESSNRKCQAKPGEVLEAGSQGIVVAAGSGALVIEELQLEAKKRMSAADFLAGNKIVVGEILGPAEK
ncbi:MAG: methionyl-tRNA formyltransferase, partial [Candidatus Omnitrophota bacterium]|nr:methionyl-tRNA formyltransferase [Candidatus Omnitrophota bacterium]